jgi:hypothetical protein
VHAAAHEAHFTPPQALPDHRNHRRRRDRAGQLLLIVKLCGSSGPASAKPGKVTLVVYSAQGYDHAMTTTFTKPTGIPVKRDDNGLIIHPTNGPTLQAPTSGQIKLALVQSSAGIGAVLGDKKLTVKYLAAVTLLPSAIGIDAGAPAAERAEAEKFISFVLSPAGTVADVAFRGRGYEHAIDIPGHGRLTGVFADTRSARGETVGLRLEASGCHLLAAAGG